MSSPNSCSHSTCCSAKQENTQKLEAVGKRFSWQLEGMDCPSCAAKVEKAVEQVNGVIAARVAFSTERLIVSANAELNPDEIIETIESTGFTVVDGSKSDKQKVTSRNKPLYYILAVAILFAIAMLSGTFNPDLKQTLLYGVTLIALLPIGKKAVSLMRNGSPFSIETLMSVAVIGALFLGETVEAAMVLLLFMIGEQLEGFAANKARSGVQKLVELTPDQVRHVKENGEIETVPVSAVLVGDKIEVLPGERLSVDGELLSCHGHFDQSALTGEPLPVELKSKSNVMAGSLVVDKTVRLKVTSEQGDSAVDRIIRLIEEAEEKKAPVERFIDKFSRWYTPLMMFIASLVAVLPPIMAVGDWQEWIYKALTLLLIACPCALVISTPAAITSALANATRRGALIKGGLALEQLGRVDKIAFDKTGTLTQGKPEVVDFQGDDALLALAASIEMKSTHPLAIAIVKEAKRRHLTLPEATDTMTISGVGASGVVGHQSIQVLAPRHIPELNNELQAQIHSFESKGQTVVVVTVDEQPKALIALQDTLRQDAIETIRSLKALGIESVMLTGDNQLAAASIASQLDMSYRAELMPGDKLSALESISGNIAMVGDGINDAPALKAASVGIAMGSGTDVALETADCALTHSRLQSITGLIKLSRKTMQIIRQNVALAIGSKVLFLVTTLLGVTGLWAAVLADTGATALVTLNALRLLKENIES
ncbi:heavy metal translocating P-type ATPase [Vibrio agarivorans]|uniref:P-type Zn(2+) transporter n=1 Tax=Vibrio agarivorans TaxID=153622 RepID=A0ABT7XZZ6_9VIBR|nr:heavy metal translocating P-type ATPase [Vibrio agarivorans]MDN2481358.1 heavy metal translocating P-type ATPase [Vibrio agarivorans]